MFTVDLEIFSDDASEISLECEMAGSPLPTSVAKEALNILS